jgi:hypothetical protein
MHGVTKFSIELECSDERLAAVMPHGIASGTHYDEAGMRL